MRRSWIGKPLRSLRRSAVHLNNVALAPASLLPFKTQWQAIVNDLPCGEVLILLPYQARQQRIARFVASHLRTKGKQVKVMGGALPQQTAS